MKKNAQLKLLFVVNKDGHQLGPSETFLTSQIEGLPCTVTTLIGNPGYRCLEGSHYVPSRALFPLGLRKIAREVGLSSSQSQDTKALVDLIRREKFDVVLAQYGSTAVTVMEACVKTKAPLVAHFHGWDAYSKNMLEAYGENYKQMFGNACSIVAVSTDMCRQLIELGAPPEKVFHNACGADIPERAHALPSESQPRFVMVGRLIEKKSPFLSLLAFRHVVAEYPEARLEIVGDGPLRNACVQLIKGLGLERHVVLHGAQSHRFVFELLASARCFFQHSVVAPDGDHEGTPVAILEAMAMGLPVVSTRHGGIMDVIQDGITGDLVDEYDVTGMAEKLLIYARNPERAYEIGKRARDAVLNNWTREKSVSRLWGIIQRAAGRLDPDRAV